MPAPATRPELWIATAAAAPFIAQLARQAEKAALKEAAALDKAAAKAAKRFDSFTARKHNGSFYEYESVLVMDEATAHSALGMSVSTELDRRKTMTWQVQWSLSS